MAASTWMWGLTATSKRSHSLSRSSTTGLTWIHPEGVGGAHGEHDGGHHVFEGEAGGQGALEVVEIDVVVLPDLDADGLVLDVHPEQGRGW